MKRFLFALPVALVVMGLLLLAGCQSDNGVGSDPVAAKVEKTATGGKLSKSAGEAPWWAASYPLVQGTDQTPVGTVLVWNDLSKVYFTIVPSANITVAESQLGVGTSPITSNPASLCYQNGTNGVNEYEIPLSGALMMSDCQAGNLSVGGTYYFLLLAHVTGTSDNGKVYDTPNTSAACVFARSGKGQDAGFTSSCTFNVVPLFTISGRLTHDFCTGNQSENGPVASSGISVTTSTNVVLNYTTDANGTYTSELLPGGTYTVSSAYTGTSSNVTVGPSTVANFNKDDRPNGSCSEIVGTVNHIVCNGNTSSTVPLAGVTVNGGSLGTATTDANGNFTFPNVPVGSYTVTVDNIGSADVAVTSTSGAYSAGTLTRDDRPNGSCAEITGHADQLVCVGQSAVTVPASGVFIDGGSLGTVTTDANGNFTFSNVAPGSYTITPPAGYAPSSSSVTVSSTDGNNAAGTFTLDVRGPICGGQCFTCPTPEGCSLSMGYWFAKPQAVWPGGTVEVGGYTYTQAEGVAIWNTSNAKGMLNAKLAFLQVAAVKLSGTSVSATASVWADVAIAEAYLSSIPKLSPTSMPANSKTGPNKAAGEAGGRIGNWINDHHCTE